MDALVGMCPAGMNLRRPGCRLATAVALQCVETRGGSRETMAGSMMPSSSTTVGARGGGVRAGSL